MIAGKRQCRLLDSSADHFSSGSVGIPGAQFLGGNAGGAGLSRPNGSVTPIEITA